MAARLAPHFILLVQDCLLKSFWYKPDLKAFLRRSGVSETALARLDNQETKRQWLDHLFPRLEQSERGMNLIQQMARHLADQTSFPGLSQHEDAAKKIKEAKAAVKTLKDYLAELAEEQRSEAEQRAVRERASEAREKASRVATDLAGLRLKLDSLAATIGDQATGYAFQTWFYEMLEFFDVDCRRPYIADGRQIDGSATVEGTTYLVELKFTGDPAGPTDIDSIKAKINSKADNTMGIVVSMSGFNERAIAESSYAKTPLLLFDYGHLYTLLLSGVMSFQDMIGRARRHSSQTGDAYLSAKDFGR